MPAMKRDQPGAGFFAPIMQAWLLIPAFGLLLLGSMWGRTLYQLASEEQTALTTGMHDTESFVAAFEQHTLRALKDADRTALLVKHEFERDGTVNVSGLVREGLIPADGFTVISITDGLGNVVASSQTFTETANVADRDYFRLHAGRDIGRVDISKPESGVLSRRQSIQFTRRLNLGDGSFGGIVLLSVNPDYFTGFYQ
jgi:hypothetical protein